MNRNQHIEHLISEYTLELLSKKESKTVSDHLAVCKECRLVLHNERQLVLDIRDSIAGATGHDRRRLQELMPPLPTTKDHILGNFGWQRRLAIIGFLLILVFGSLSIERQLSTEIWVSRAPAFKPTMILATETPTQTSMATRPESTSPILQPTPISKSAILLPRPALAPAPPSPILYKG